jgi:diadenosine tetraphosphatase ApaH/serine/threonine PP2A family protein phosphatase
MEWLRSLPHGPIQVAALSDAQLVHGSPLDEDEYIVNLQDAVEPLLLSSVSLTLFGHTHLQGAFSMDGAKGETMRPMYKTVGRSETLEYPLKPGVRYLVNPGSIGQPRDGDWRAAFALLDTETRLLTYCRTPYNLKAAQERILTANLPQRLATRLAAGR